MFLLNRDIINKYPLLITIFNLTNTLLGIIAFYFVHKTIKNNKKNGIIYCNLYWIIPYMIMFAILGFGYDRFLYPYSYNEYHKNYFNRPKLYLFFNCNVFYTLLIMGIILIPLIYYPIFKWNQLTQNELIKIKWFVIKYVYLCMILFIIGYIIFINYYCDIENQLFYIDKRIKFAGVYAPIVGFVTFIHSLFLLALVPIFCRKGKSDKLHKK